jgi:glycosyltransferase involved in cell wall biosynthesis
MRRMGHRGRIDVVPHGCVRFDDVRENWNITGTPYAIVQFGFGFRYKGVDVALEAIARLKAEQPGKYADIHYCYLCSENEHARSAVGDNHRGIVRKVSELGLEDNAVVVRGYQSDEVINQYLRTYKLAVFPYVRDPHNVVYGSSGAARLAMANRIPTIASGSPMFDDLEGVLPRPSGPEELAREIDAVFSNWDYRESLIDRADRYVSENRWDVAAARYLDVLGEIATRRRK